MLIYNIDRVWNLLKEAEQTIAWKKKFPGAPSYFQIYDYLVDQGLQEHNYNLYSQLKAQLDFNYQYEVDHFEELRG